jgi:exodeoxyribonuclease VII small subunit
MSKKPEKLPHLEPAMLEINTLVSALEAGELSLDESLSKFERGVNLIRHCQTILQTAEQKVQILIQKNDTQTLQSFEQLDE